MGLIQTLGSVEALPQCEQALQLWCAVSVVSSAAPLSVRAVILETASAA